MLEKNLKWLEQVNPALLAKYSEPYIGEVIRFSYEEPPTQGRPNEIGPKFYQAQQSHITGTAEPILGIVSGTNGGEMVEHLLDFKHLIVVEHSEESFLRSLKVVDWPGLFDHFKVKGGSLFLQIGDVRKSELRQHLDRIGTFNAHATSVSYDGSQKSVDNLHAIMGTIRDSIVDFGYFDDERVGMAHTVANLQGAHRILAEYRPPHIEKPVVVCGNGPGLSALLPMLKYNRESLFIVSCGTTLGTLFEAGIKPDIHTEKERPYFVHKWVKNRTTAEYRNGIKFVALNVMAPAMVELFEEVYFVMKPNEFGTTLVNSIDPKIPFLPFTAPLAANFGVALVAAMGFKNVYLAGIDCAFTDDGERHASYPHAEPPKDRQYVPGNFREKVLTESDYNASRHAIEECIRCSNGIKYFNLSDGALIKGAKPAREIELHDGSLDFDGFREFRLSFDRMSIQRQCLNAVHDLICHAHCDLDIIYGRLHSLRESNPVGWNCIKGTVQTQLVFLATANENEKAMAYAIFAECLEEMGEVIASGLFELCRWEDNGLAPRG